MQTVTLNSTSFSKIILGSNPFYGHSHFSQARNEEYLNRFTDGYLEEIIRFCMSKGINTVESCHNDRIWSIIETVRKDHPLHFISTTRIDETSPMKSHQQKLNDMLAKRADICVIHSQFVDRPVINGDIKGLQRMVEKIHEAGLLAGISTHRVSTVETCEKNNYGLDVYLFPLNMTGYVFPGYDGHETPEERVNLIQNTDKTFILMKSLASGRIPPAEGLQFVLENIKKNDLISLGLSSLKEAEESLGIITNIIPG